MEGVFDLFKIPVGEKIEKGEITISTFEFRDKDHPLFNLRLAVDSGAEFTIRDGKYVRLHVNKELMMSDTQMERRSNYQFCRVAHGRVLIAGLGIGLIIHNLRKAVETGKVSSIIVIEKSQDLIDLIKPYFDDFPRLQIIQGDIFEWRPEKGSTFNTIYFDIWPEITDANLEEIKKLHNRFKFFKDKTDPECWMNSWMKERIQKERRKERRKERNRYSYW